MAYQQLLALYILMMIYSTCVTGCVMETSSAILPLQLISPKRLNFLMHILQENVAMKLSWKGLVNKCRCNKVLIIVVMYVLSHRCH